MNEKEIHKKKKRLPIAILILLLLVLVVAILYFSLKNNNYIPLGGSRFIDGYVLSYLSFNGTHATLEIEKWPVPLNNVIIENITNGSIVSINNISYKIMLSPIKLELLETTNSTQKMFATKTLNTTTTIKPKQNITTTKNTTTISTSTTSIATSISTTISQTNVILSKALPILNSTNIPKLVNELNFLYQNAYYNCTESLYNKTFFAQFNKQPTGPNSYYNITNATPIKIAYNYTIGKNGNIMFDYYAIFRNGTKENSILVYINVNQSSINNEIFTGPFYGQNITTLYNSYEQEVKIGACGAFIP